MRKEPFLLKPVEPIVAKLGNYVLVEHDKPLPVCVGCFNVGESCGTPCVDCDRRVAWDKAFDFFLYLEGFFHIFKRKGLV